MTYEIGSRYPKPGEKVKIVQKKDYASSKLTEGVIKDVLTKKQIHPRGHKVRLTSGIIGRVQDFADEKETNKEQQSPVANFKPGDDDLL